MSFSLSKAGETLINVAADYTTLQNTVSGLVSQYNSLQQFVRNQSVAKTDPTVRQVMSDLRNQLLSSSGNGQYKYLGQIGVQFNTDGTLTFNQATLQSALSSSATDVQALFQGSGNNGLFNSFRSALQNDDSTAGLLSTATTSNKTEIQSLTAEISSQQQMLDNRQRQLTKMYAAADQAMIALRSSGQSLTQLGAASLF